MYDFDGALRKAFRRKLFALAARYGKLRKASISTIGTSLADEWEYTLRDKHDLAKLLRAGWPLSLEDNRFVADLLDGKIKRGRGRPAGRSAEARNLARVVAHVKLMGRLLRTQGTRYRIHDRAICDVLESLAREGEHPLPSRERIENALRRSRKRRKPAR